MFHLWLYWKIIVKWLLHSTQPMFTLCLNFEGSPERSTSFLPCIRFFNSFSSICKATSNFYIERKIEYKLRVQVEYNVTKSII